MLNEEPENAFPEPPEIYAPYVLLLEVKPVILLLWAVLKYKPYVPWLVVELEIVLEVLLYRDIP